jgi:aspartate dehydrogenase
MKLITIIGCGAIGEAVVRYLADHDDVAVAAAIIEPGTDARARDMFGPDVQIAYDFDSVSADVDLAADCAGHPALRQHGEAILSSGTDLVSVRRRAAAVPSCAWYPALSGRSTHSLRAAPVRSCG